MVCHEGRHSLDCDCLFVLSEEASVVLEQVPQRFRFVDNLAGVEPQRKHLFESIPN